MKKLLPILIVGILVISGLGAVALPNNATSELSEQSITIHFSNLIIYISANPEYF